MNKNKTLSRTVEGKGPMKPGNQSKDNGANSFRFNLKDEDDAYI